MMVGFLRRAVMGFWLSALPALSLAQPQSMHTWGECSPIASGTGATVNAYCFGISKEALERLTDIVGSSRGRRLFVMEAWLSPSPMFGRPSVGKYSINEQAYVSLRVRNISGVPVLLTAAKLEVANARNLTKGGGNYSSESLWPAQSMNQPITISPGKDRIISFAEGLVLKGMAIRIRENVSLDTAHTVPTTPLRINGKEYVEWFAKQMSLLYGVKARLHLSLYEGDYKLLAQLSVPLAQGEDFFYRSEVVDKKGHLRYEPRLAYDAFLGEYLKMREIWEPGFRINIPPTRMIEAIPDATVPGGMRYRDHGQQDKHSIPEQQMQQPQD